MHEYVHTQQQTTIGDNLLAQCVIEGVAEFVAVKATGKQSTAPAMHYGKENFERVRTKFITQMFNPFTGFWLYSNAKNEFNIRDLGYYVGYTICEKYYEKAANKNQAIKEMIELNYNKPIDLAQFVDKSGYFANSVKLLQKKFDKSRPTVLRIKEFKNESQKVNPDLKEITIEFSDPMDNRFRNFELGPLGEKNVLQVKKFIGFSQDGKSITFEIEMKPSHRYQLIIGSEFRTADKEISLNPYLIDFKTADK